MATVIVTGGSGFVGSHVIVRLLAAGHAVRATLRSLSRADEVRAMVRRGGQEPDERLTFHIADLERDAGWAEAVAGCDYVQHVASPFPQDVPKNENDLIRPAREGTLRILRMARDAGVKRVVLTSSFAAIGYGHPPRDAPFDERDWSHLDAPDAQAYIKSKTLAERAAWDFIAQEGGALELAVVNPVAIFGPALGPDVAASLAIMQAMLAGQMPVAPRIHFGVVDVRDVADLLLLAMERPEAANERFLATAGSSLSLIEVSRILRAGLGKTARKAPRHELPDRAVRLLAWIIPRVRGAVPHLGKRRDSSAAKAKAVFGWQPRPREEALLAAGQSLIDLGVVGAGKPQ